jgi:hypothetical protein
VKDFPELEFCVDEINSYKLLCGNLRETIDIKDVWSIYKKQLPKLHDLAKVFLHFPVSTASVERSFSKYNTLLADDRLRLKPETIKELLYIYYNKNITNFEELKIDVEEDEENEIMIMPDDNGNISGINESDLEVEIEDVFS